MPKKKEKEYSSIIDAFLDVREPDWKELGLKDAVKSGETQLSRTHDYIDGDVLEEISESIDSHHTMLPAGGKGGKKKLVSSVPEDWARHSKSAINEDTVLGEALHDLESKLHSNENGLKKAITDADVIGRIDKILGSGLSSEAKKAALKKLGDIELFNRGMATDYLRNAAPQLGIDWLQPNTYMDKESPDYERADVALASEEDPFGDITPLTPVEGVESEDANMEVKKGSGPTILASYGYKKVGVIVTREPEEDMPLENCIKCRKPTPFWYNEGEEPLCEGCAPSTSPEDIARLIGGKRASSSNTFHHESGSSIKVSKNGWSFRAKGGVEQASGTSFKALIATLNKAHARQAPIQVGQRSTEISYMSNQGGMRRNVEQKFAHTTSQVAAQTAVEFDSGDIEKFRKAGQSLSYIYRFAEAKVGTLGASKAMNEWLSGKKRAEGKLVLASTDVDFLREKMGYRIPSKTEVGQRSTDVSTVQRNLQKQAAPVTQSVTEFTSNSVEKLHKAKYTLAQIYNYAEKKFGSVTASESIKGWLRGKKQSGVIPVLANSDKDLLKKLGYKPFRETGEVATNVHKAAATSPVDGHAMMNEFDLTERTPAQEINTDGVKLEDVELNGTFGIDV